MQQGRHVGDRAVPLKGFAELAGKSCRPLPHPSQQIPLFRLWALLDVGYEEGYTVLALGSNTSKRDVKL